MRGFVVTVMSLDRPGIIAGISEAIFKLGGNIEEISQTVVRGYFTVILYVSFPSDAPSPEEIKRAVASSGRPGELEVAVREDRGEPRYHPPEKHDRFVLTLFGRDQPGIIRRISTYLARNGINITDLYGKAEEGGFTMVLELTVPSQLDPRLLKEELEELGRSIGLSAHLQHENLFKATHDLRSIVVPTL